MVQLDLRTVYLKHLQIHGSSQGTRAAFRRLVRYIEEGKIRALVGGVYRLSEFRRAQTDFMAKRFIGKLVVDQVTQFIDQAPEKAQSVEDWVNRTFGTNLSNDQISPRAAMSESSSCDRPMPSCIPWSFLILPP